MRHFRLPILAATSVLVLFAGCEHSTPARAPDSAAALPITVGGAAAAVPSTTTWDASAGAALLVQGESAGEAILVLPDPSSAPDALRSSASVSLFGRGGSRSLATLGGAESPGDPECRLSPVRDAAGNAPGAWSVGFVGGNVTPIALDSLDVLSSRDSSALAAEASRLASAVTAASPASFQGLRFAAYDMRRFQAAPGTAALVAHVMRRVNQEANPQEEQTLLIAERDSGDASGPYHLVFAERSHGLEEQGVTPEIIAAVSIAGHVTLVVAHDGERGVTYSFVQRDRQGKWRARWSSAPTRCG